MTSSEKLLDNLAADHADLPGLLRWAWNDAHWPTNATPPPRRPKDPPEKLPVGTGVLTLPEHFPGVREPAPLPAPAQPERRQLEQDRTDQVPGPRHAIGIGSDRRREAYRQALHHLRAAELHLLVAAALPARGQGLYEPRQLPPGLHAPDVAVRAVAANVRRAHQVQRATIPPQLRRAVKAQLEKAVQDTRAAWHVLTHSMAEGEAGAPETHAVAPRDRCKNWRAGCHRQREEKTGGRCYGCKYYFEKHREEKPAELLRKGVSEAIAAKGRREARGEGWGQG